MNDKELAELRGRYKPRTMNDEQLAEIRARCEAATPGPWEVHEDRVSGMWVDRSVWAGIEGVCGDIAQVNATFIAHARADVPTLLAEVERLRAALELVEGVNDGLGGHYCPWCNGKLDGLFVTGHREDCRRQLALEAQP